MKRKIAAILVMLLLVISIPSLVLADDAGDEPEEEPENDSQAPDDETPESGDSAEETEESEEVDDDATEKEIQIMPYPYGAEIRLLQLQKALLRNILKAQMIIGVLQDMEFNTSELEGILVQMNELLDEVQAADPAANDSVQVFVALKYEAINLTKQYRETLHALVDDATLQQLRNQIRNATSDALRDYSSMIRERIRHFNRNQLHRLYGFIGTVNNSLIDEYFNGTISLGQVKLKLSAMVNQMTQEEKHSFFSELREDNIRRQIYARATMSDMPPRGIGKGQGKP